MHLSKAVNNLFILAICYLFIQWNV